MNFASTIIGTAERVPLPDVIVRAAINRLCSRTGPGLRFAPSELIRQAQRWNHAHNRVSPEKVAIIQHDRVV